MYSQPFHLRCNHLFVVVSAQLCVPMWPPAQVLSRWRHLYMSQCATCRCPSCSLLNVLHFLMTLQPLRTRRQLSSFSDTPVPHHGHSHTAVARPVGIPLIPLIAARAVRVLTRWHLKEAGVTP